MYQLLIIVFITLIFLAIRYIRQQPAEMQSGLRWRFGLYALLGLAVLLVMSGKLHWVAGAIAAAFPLILRFSPLFMRGVPFLKRQYDKRQATAPDVSSPFMDSKKALQVFGFKTLPEEDKIVQRHRELMQKNHPDRGGSDFIAAQINQAKDVLLAESKIS